MQTINENDKPSTNALTQAHTHNVLFRIKEKLLVSREFFSFETAIQITQWKAHTQLLEIVRRAVVFNLQNLYEQKKK